MIIYVNGDSYTEMSDGKRYSEFLANRFDCKFMDAAISGSSNSRILRTSLRDLISLQKQHDEIVAVIGLSFTIRTELWDPNIINNRFEKDGEFVSIQPTINKDWFKNKKSNVNSLYKSYADEFLRWFNPEAETVNLLKEILLLTTWCKYNKIKYVIFSAVLQEPVDLESEFIKSFYDNVAQDKNVLDIFKFSFTEWCLEKGHIPIDQYTQEIHGKKYNIGHHGEKAHQDFANFLFENYLN
jgi:hypothetical protein